MLGYYLIDPNYIKTKEKIEYVGKQTTQDFMLSSLNVTDIAQDNQKLIWIGTSAGINVYNGKDYLQQLCLMTTSMYYSVTNKARCG